MPELPEVQTVADSIKDDIINEVIDSIEVKWPRVLDNFNSNDIKHISDLRITSVSRRAKFILIQLKKELIAIHLRMTGKLYIQKDENYNKHVTAIILFKSGKKLIFEDTRKFGRVYLYQNLDIINSRHGLEPLEKNFTIDWLHQNLKKKNRKVKALLLDQSFIAGLGNIYVDESLWISGINPLSISSKIPKKNIKKLHFAIQKVLTDSINSLGTTIVNFSFLNGQSGNYGNNLNVFGNDGKPCPRCSLTIIKDKLCGRGTHYCKKCQKIFA